MFWCRNYETEVSVLYYSSICALSENKKNVKKKKKKNNNNNIN